MGKRNERNDIVYYFPPVNKTIQSVVMEVMNFNEVKGRIDAGERARD
jgi:hypothetical protein